MEKAIASNNVYDRLRSQYNQGTGYYVMGITLLELGKDYYAKWKQSHRYTVNVHSTDVLFTYAMDWFISQVPPENQKSIMAWTRRNSSNKGLSSDCVEVGVGEVEPMSLALSYDSKASQIVEIDGHRVEVSLEQPDAITADGERGKLLRRPDILHFTAKSEAGRAAVIAFFDKLLAANAEERKPALHLMNNWGGWRRRNDLPLRDLDQVVLADGLLEDIIQDLEKFLTSEAKYNRRGLPWHRGYLFHGPPGTGKTSLVKAISKHFGLDLWYAPLGDLTEDANLLSMVADVQPRSILLLEDADVFHATHDRDNTKGTASLSGLLNALDGVGTPHGLITIMSTNDKNKIDPAILRAGRMDRVVEIGLPDDKQATRLWEYYYGQEAPHSIPAQGRTPADFLEVFKQYEEPNAALHEVMKAIRK